MLYLICGVRPVKDSKDKFTKVCLLFKTDLPLFSVVPEPLLQLLGTEINRRLDEMKDIKNYKVVSFDDLPSHVKNYLKSQEAKDIESSQGFLVLFLEEVPTTAFMD